MSDDNGIPSAATLVSKVQELNRVIRGLEEDLASKLTERADGEATVRSQFAYRYRLARDEGLSVADSETRARAETVVLSNERDKADGAVTVILAKLEDRRGERHSLHRLIDLRAAMGA